MAHGVPRRTGRARGGVCSPNWSLVPLVYVPILRLVDGADLEAPARDLVAGAGSSALGSDRARAPHGARGTDAREEIVFRGLLFRGLARRSPRPGAIGLVVPVVVSAAVFAAFHFSRSVPGLFVIGAVAAVAVARTDRLAPAIWIHAGFNATSIVVLLRQIY
ncbi:MAG: CPBP family intramembrane glutamic endopeptidase [Acidimicrobiales bacterium]